MSKGVFLSLDGHIYGGNGHMDDGYYMEIMMDLFKVSNWRDSNCQM